MARPCSICAHPQRVAIDVALYHQQARPELAQTYDVTLEALKRHVNRHLLSPLIFGVRVEMPHAPEDRATAEECPIQQTAPEETRDATGL